MEIPKENLIHETTQSIDKSREGFEMTAEQAGQITSELSKFNDAILHDKPILIDDVEDLSKVARGTKIDVGGEVMTVEEAENDPDLKRNIQIWNEMRDGRFGHTFLLTQITPTVSKFLINTNDILLSCLISAKGLVLPQTFEGDLNLRDLTSIEGLVLSQKIGGSLYLDNLTSAVGLVLPESIGRGLSLRRLTSAEGLVLPQYVGGNIYLYNLSDTQKEKLKERYPQFKDKIK